MPPSHKSSSEISITLTLMEQVEGLRSDFRATTETIVKKLEDQGRETATKIDSLREDVSDMKVRLARGSERMENLRRDVDGLRPTALEKKKSAPSPSEATTEKSSKSSKMAWWIPLLVGGALAFVGERGAKFVINGLADAPTPPVVVAPPYPPKP